MNAIDYEHRTANVPQLSEALALELLPVTKGGHLGCRHLGSRSSIEILLALCQPFNECLTRRLARCGRCKEELLQDGVPLELWVLEVPRQARLLEMHDVFAPTRSGAYENHPPNDRGTIQCHLQGDHPAQREPEHIAAGQAQCVQKSEGVLRHGGDRSRHVATGSTDAGIVEENDLARRCEGVSHRGIPVVEGSCEVLQAQ